MSKISKREMKNIKKRKQQQREIMIEKRKRDPAVIMRKTAVIMSKNIQIEQEYKKYIQHHVSTFPMLQEPTAFQIEYLQSFISVLASLELNQVPNRKDEVFLLKTLNAILNNEFLENPSMPVDPFEQSLRLYLIKKLTINNAEFDETVRFIILDKSTF